MLGFFENPTPVIGAVMKREERYIVEWVAWHRLQGFDMIVADNCERGPQTGLLRRLEKAGYLHYLDIRRHAVSPQMPAYQAIYRRALWSGYRQIGFLDADEFFEPLGSDPFAGAAFIHGLLETPGIRACGYRWAIFGSNGEIEARDAPVMERFTRRAAHDYPVNANVKSFARMDALLLRRPVYRHGRLLFFGIRGSHTFAVRHPYYRLDGMVGIRSFDSNDLPDWNQARIRHYVVKSREEYEERTLRGDVFFKDNKYRDPDYWTHNDINDIDDPLRPSVAAALAAKIAEIDEAVART